MRKLFSLLLVAGMTIFFSCGPTEKDKEAVQKRLDSLKQDSIARMNNDLAKLKLTGKVKSLREIKFKAEEKFGEIQSEDIVGKNVLVFNEKGNKIEECQYDADDSLDHKYTYKYDDKGNVIEMCSFNSYDSLKFKNTYRYDDKGNKVEENAYNANGSLNYKFTHKYDEKGNEIEECDYKSDGSLDYKFTYKYNYNNTLNWSKETEFINGIPKNITEREIEYYK
jgi:hypothetical protein